MAGNAGKTRANVIPTLRYRDAPAALDWLCRAFGFERHMVSAWHHSRVAMRGGYILKICFPRSGRFQL